MRMDDAPTPPMEKSPRRETTAPEEREAEAVAMAEEEEEEAAPRRCRRLRIPIWIFWSSCLDWFSMTMAVGAAEEEEAWDAVSISVPFESGTSPPPGLLPLTPMPRWPVEVRRRRNRASWSRSRPIHRDRSRSRSRSHNRVRVLGNFLPTPRSSPHHRHSRVSSECHRRSRTTFRTRVTFRWYRAIGRCLFDRSSFRCDDHRDGPRRGRLGHRRRRYRAIGRYPFDGARSVWDRWRGRGRYRAIDRCSFGGGWDRRG
mmetsp:Transcript_12194/g.24380  ORF Transcript_12194/g.24380 Transcript_12194/m.24380 type:complete len:257 (-) Transcript_12194:59-829(-)